MAKWKQQKSEEKPPTTTTMNMDRIGNLPDSVLCRVLSFLPTKTSVATSILSRRWRHLWQHLEVFDFHDGSFNHLQAEEAPTRFAHFVNAVLALRRGGDIKKLSLTCDVSNIMDDVITWVYAAIGPNLHELYLNLLSVCDFEYQLPRSIFTCPTLVSVTLVGGFRLEHLSSVDLPSLKNLTVDGVFPIADLLSGCPVLETLDFYSGDEDASRYCIFSSSLKSLKFEHYAKDAIESLDIHTPSLEYLDITVKTKTKHLRFSTSDLHNVVGVRLDFPAVPVDQNVGIVPELLRAICKTEVLMLGCSTTKCLLRASAFDFPKFCYLLHLEICIPHFNLRFVMGLLHNCNILQLLRIYHWEPKGGGSNVSNWTLQSVTSVPDCVTSHLTTVTFRGYQDSEDERAFTAYILHRGLVLTTMIIYADYVDEKEKYHILKGLSEMPRGSNLCQLKFE